MSLNDAKIYTLWLGKWIIVLIGAQVLLSMLPIGRDSTDGGWPNRSNMRLLTDSATGCEYLQASNGGIIQRFDSRGNQQLGCRSIR